MTKAPSLLAIRPRSLSSKVLLLGSIITFAITLYTFSSSYSFRISDWSSIFSQQRQHNSCTPEQWSSGRWVYSPTSDLVNLTRPEQALSLAGFEGCAADREYKWHLGTDHEEQWDRFPKVSSYRWVPSRQCDVHPLNGAAMVKDMVENGGWLLLGDSITENHFFSLSCLLYPHVRATPNYTENPYFDRAWQQHLYLSPSSPIIPEITMPEGFSIENTPLVSFRRVDLLLNGTELNTIYHSSAFSVEPTGLDNQDNNTKAESLFGDEAFWSLSPSEYMSTFLDSPPDANYGTLVVSTAGHWTTTALSAFRDEDAGESAGYGIHNVLAFFKVAMRTWAGEVQDAITKYRINGGRRPKQVVVRAYLPGHENCHNIFEPTERITPWVYTWYNWPWIPDFNTEFQELLSSSSEFPDIHYLPIERPGRLRPDAHASGDCLHLISGAGVLEGWSHYIWHFVTREVKQKDMIYVEKYPYIGKHWRMPPSKDRTLICMYIWHQVARTMPTPPDTSVGYRYSILEMDWDVSLDVLFSTFTFDDSSGSEWKSWLLRRTRTPGPISQPDVNLLDVPSDSLRILLDTSAGRSLAAITKSADLPDQVLHESGVTASCHGSHV